MPAHNETLKSYKVGDTAWLPLSLRDDTGIDICSAMFYRLPSPEHNDDIDFDNFVEFIGDGHGRKSGVIYLTTTLTHQPPGLYHCSWIQTRDVVGNIRTIDDPDPRLKFRVEETPGADLEGPEVIEIGELEEGAR